MTRAMHVLLATMALGVVVGGENTAVTPVQKVIGLMNNMVEKGKEEKNAEEVQFAAFNTFCKTTIAEKTRLIQEANEMIEVLQADIQKYAAEAATAAKEIAQHDGDISTWEGNLKAATGVRDQEKADYIQTHKDYTESINALEEAVTTFKMHSHDVKQGAASLAQVASLVKLSFPQKRVIDAFLHQQPSDENLALAAPESKAYEDSSQAIIEMLDELRLKFEDERTDLEKMETNAIHAYEMLSADLKANIEAGTEAREEKSEAKGKALQAEADSKGSLVDTTGTRDEDIKYSSDLGATCEQKSAAFAERQKLRAEEIEAIEKAIEIMSSPDVAGASEEHLPQLLQMGTKRSFAQLRSSAQNPAQLRVAAYLKGQATRLNSRMLSALATKVSDDPFKKVKKMIKDLVVKLMEEAAEEAEHKGWCDTELSTNEQTRKEKTEATEILTAEIDELESSIAKITEEVTELSKAVADLDAAMAKATGIRAEEKVKNTQTIADAQAAQKATAKALGVLRDFYEKAGEATALVQSRAKQQPEVFSDEPYKGMGGASGGVVGMLEVIESDFARLEADTTAAEEQAQKEYDEFKSDSSLDKAQKSSDLDHLSEKRQNQGQALEKTKADLEGTQKELDAAMAYYAKLKPSCVNEPENYEDRVARRKEEIESLEEALRILQGEDIAFLQQDAMQHEHS